MKSDDIFKLEKGDMVSLLDLMKVEDIECIENGDDYNTYFYCKTGYAFFIEDGVEWDWDYCVVAYSPDRSTKKQINTLQSVVIGTELIPGIVA